MATRKVKSQGTSSETNAEGNEKLDNTSSTVSDIQGYSLHDDNAKVAGLANGLRQHV